jgi:hypothetical protein
MMRNIEQRGSVDPSLDNRDEFPQAAMFAIDGVPDNIERLHGVERITLFEPSMQKSILNGVEEWFDKNKGAIPPIGLLLEADREVTAIHQQLSVNNIAAAKMDTFGIELSPEVVGLCDTIIRHSENDPELKGRNVRFVFERTGATTHEDDRGYHADTRQVYFDEQGQRTGYDSTRSLPKYMVFIGRPGTVFIHGKIDPSLTFEEGLLLGHPYKVASDGITVTQEGFDPPIVSQLLPQSIYKVSVGELLHSPPAHQDGLLITASFNN